MATKTGISWTDSTWTPLTGCTRVSPACDSCYAFQLHDQRHVAWKRGRYPQAAAQYHEPFSTVQLLPARLEEPLHWKQPRKVFLTSMGDVFHEDVPTRYLDRVFTTVETAFWHTFQVLTKRPERMRRYFDGPRGPIVVPVNTWLGTTVEDQQRAIERIPALVSIAAPTHWLSCEPLLGPLDLAGKLDCIDWLVLGGESGPHYREMDLHWLEAVIEQCKAVRVAVWVKQDSGRFPGKQGRIPDELWLHEFPAAVAVS